MKLYRVFPFDAGAAPTDRGGALFVPAASGQSRIDNADLYDVLYVSAEPHAAVAEALGRIELWRSATFVHPSGRPLALATFEAPDGLPLFDLNDVDALHSIGITRPTDVVTRDRSITQAWARTIFERGGFAGVRWWSYYNPDWPVIGLWNHNGLVLARPPEILTVDGAIVLEAAAAIVRQIAP
ncbi:MAG TPA: RES family NAD+ phosphorylase [Candidatus Elarobacter sp.]|nr:RES family NAD+ phosphorylase [Candidatus Elarobacter sp.]